MSESNEPDLYAQEGQIVKQEEGIDNDNDDDDDIVNDLPSSNKGTPGGPTAGCDDHDPSADDDEMNDDDMKPRNNVDLCILCDVTDSMNLWIKQIKSGIRRIVNELKNTFGIGKLRLSFIGYRDWNDDNNNKGEKRIEKLEFTSDIDTFESFLDQIKAVGGGDAAEDVLGGIQETLSIAWKAPIRVVYHICDAPAHGTMYHDLYDAIKTDEDNVDYMSFLDGMSEDETDSDDEDGKQDELVMMKGDMMENKDTKERELQILRDEFDKWPHKYPEDPKHEDLFVSLKQKNVQFYIGTQTKFTDKMVKVFMDYCDSIDYSFTTMDLINVTQFLPTLIEAVSDAIRVVFKKRPNIDLNLKELQKRKTDFEVYCGIDFGTAGSGFAYALPGKNEVYTDQNWNDSGKHVDVKTKTNILLDADGNCIAFGDDATDKYTHTDTNDLFFERFKMALYDDEKQAKVDDDDDDEKKIGCVRIDIVDTLTAANGKQLSSRKVLEEALRFMKDHAMNNLRQKVNKTLQIQDVQWILTVPAIWSEKAKSVMKRAAINAGMIDASINGHLIIAYEPDCASLSIQHEINEKARTMHKQQRQIKKSKLRAAQNIKDEYIEDEDEDEYKSFFECGDKILLCDLGGGTADIACHEIDENECIRQIVAPSGGAWGSTYVDECFLELLGMVFSAEWMDEFKVSHPSTYIEFLSNFRVAKKTYKMKDKKKVKKKALDTTFHNVKVPFVFLDFMGEKAEEKAHENEDNDDGDDDDDDDDDLAVIVNSFVRFSKKGLIKLNDEYLEISYVIWNLLFDTVVDPIIAHCASLLRLPEMRACKYLVLVGGFSESKHLQSKIFSNFGKKSSFDIMIFTPKRPILSVVDGAARMGLKPDFISARTVAKTYGIAIQKDLFEFKGIFPHALIPKVKISKRLVYAANNKKRMISKQVVNDVFLPFVRRNTLIKNNDEPIVYWVEPADVTADKISIKLYDSNECDPMFVDGKEANKIEIQLSHKYMQHKQAIPIIFIFNDTTIRVFVKMQTHDGSHQIKEISIDFDVVR